MRTVQDVLTFCLSAGTSALAGRRYLSCLWEVTYRCTARCSKCGYWKMPARRDEELTAQQVEQGLDRVFAFGCRLVNFTGGEPTLRGDLERIVAHASGLGMWTSVVTNGDLLTRERVRALRHAGLDNLLVSLDSTSPAMHDEARGTAGSFDQVDACAGWIRDEFLRGHRTGGVMCAITRQNAGELRDIARFARAHGIFVLFQPYHANKTGDAYPVPDLGEQEVRELVELTGGPRVVLNSRRYLLGLNRTSDNGHSRPCHAGEKYFSVDPFGNLHPCVDMPAVGHVLTTEITEVRSARAKEVVAKCAGCWYCFRGEADTSLSLAGCLEKLRLGLSVVRHNTTSRYRANSGEGTGP